MLQIYLYVCLIVYFSVSGGRSRDYPEETDSLLSSSRPENEDFDDAGSEITSVSQAAESKGSLRVFLSSTCTVEVFFFVLEGRRMGLQPQQRLRASGGGGNKPAPLPGPGIRPPHLAASSRRRGGGLESASSMLSSDIESSIYDDTEDGRSFASSSRFGTTDTEHTSVSRQAERQKRRSKRRAPAHMLARAGSMSSVTDSTVSLNTITVTLNMDSVSFLGISIVGQSNKLDNNDCGIYVGSIMTGGAVAQDGRIQPGDMILQVNDVSFESMSNDEAVAVLREVVQKPGPIKLVVAKCWDQPTTAASGMTSSAAGGRNNFVVPRDQPVRPIDPGAWVAHIAACNMGESLKS